jgi:hypothetical protein
MEKSGWLEICLDLPLSGRFQNGIYHGKDKRLFDAYDAAMVSPFWDVILYLAHQNIRAINQSL